MSRPRKPADMPQEMWDEATGSEKNGHERTMFSAAELLEMDLPPIKWAIPDILPEGVTILAGRAKIGKSFLAFGLCVAVAMGGEALGHIPVGRGPVLYIALEDNKRRLKKRLRGLLNGSPAPDDLTISIEWPRLDDGGVERLDGWLEEHPDARLVVIDILKSIRPRGAAGRNIYDLDYEALEPLKPLIEKHGVSIVVVHHLNQGTTQDPLQLISGSEGLVGVVDGTLVLRRERGKHDATLHVAGKDIEEEREHALRWDAPLMSWTLVGDAEDFRMSDQRREIRAAMLGLSRPVTTAEVANKVDKDYQATRYLMVRMEEEGLIRLHHTEGATKYYIVPSYTPPKNTKNTKNTQDPKTPKSSQREDGDLRDLRDLRAEEGGQSGRLSADECNAEKKADDLSLANSLLINPPPWLKEQLDRYSEDRDRYRKSVCTAVAAKAWGDVGLWKEVVPLLVGTSSGGNGKGQVDA